MLTEEIKKPPEEALGHHFHHANGSVDGRDTPCAGLAEGRGCSVKTLHLQVPLLPSNGHLSQARSRTHGPLFDPDSKPAKYVYLAKRQMRK